MMMQNLSLFIVTVIISSASSLFAPPGLLPRSRAFSRRPLLPPRLFPPPSARPVGFPAPPHLVPLPPPPFPKQPHLFTVKKIDPKTGLWVKVVRPRPKVLPRKAKLPPAIMKRNTILPRMIQINRGRDRFGILRHPSRHMVNQFPVPNFPFRHFGRRELDDRNELFDDFRSRPDERKIDDFKDFEDRFEHRFTNRRPLPAQPVNPVQLGHFPAHTNSLALGQPAFNLPQNHQPFIGPSLPQPWNPRRTSFTNNRFPGQVNLGTINQHSAMPEFQTHTLQNRFAPVDDFSANVIREPQRIGLQSHITESTAGILGSSDFPGIPAPSGFPFQNMPHGFIPAPSAISSDAGFIDGPMNSAVHRNLAAKISDKDLHHADQHLFPGGPNFDFNGPDGFSVGDGFINDGASHVVDMIPHAGPVFETNVEDGFVQGDHIKELELKDALEREKPDRMTEPEHPIQGLELLGNSQWDDIVKELASVTSHGTATTLDLPGEPLVVYPVNPHAMSENIRAGVPGDGVSLFPVNPTTDNHGLAYDGPLNLDPAASLDPRPSGIGHGAFDLLGIDPATLDHSLHMAPPKRETVGKTTDKKSLAVKFDDSPKIVDNRAPLHPPPIPLPPKEKLLKINEEVTQVFDSSSALKATRSDTQTVPSFVNDELSLLDSIIVAEAVDNNLDDIIH